MGQGKPPSTAWIPLSPTPVYPLTPFSRGNLPHKGGRGPLRESVLDSFVLWQYDPDDNLRVHVKIWEAWSQEPKSADTAV